MGLIGIERRMLDDRANWSLLHFDANSVILARNVPANRRIIDVHGYRALRPWRLDFGYANLADPPTRDAIQQDLALARSRLPDEPLHLLVAQSRPGGSNFWNGSKTTTQLFDIKREIEVLASAMRIPVARLEYRFQAESGRFQYTQRGRRLIEGGVISARMAQHWNLEQPVWFAEFDMSALSELREALHGFKPLPEYPPSRRDLSLVIPAGVAYGDLEKALARSGGRLLESSQVFDVYQGGSLTEGHTAIGVRLTFRSHEGTLTDADVDAVVAKIVRKLESEFTVRLRS